MKTRPRASLLHLLALVALALVALQLYFALRIALMAVVDPNSTSFQRSEVWRLLGGEQTMGWRQRWVDDSRISPHLKRAVIASEDSSFAEHNGVDWDALEKAWERNQKAQTRAEMINARFEAKTPRKVEPKVIGGSTITQQLAKNLFLSSERSLPRKAQEFVLTLMIEAMLDKRRILEIYLNSVEWGEGIFGAEAAAQHYFHTSAAQLTPMAAARLAVMLPAPKRFQKRPDSPYLLSRAATVSARMGAVELP
jgi:monofunctional biosynthetic peptidoglycan transglycosylase